MAHALLREGRLAEARQTAEAGLATLDVAHPDAIVGRSHLGAIVAGVACGCGDIQGTIAEAFREFVRSRLPQDLLAQLEVTIENENFEFNVELRREPTEDELEQLNRVMEGAMAEFRHRLAAAKYAS